MKDKDMLKLLLKNGWKLDRVNGSHHILVRGNQHISLPIHGQDLKPGLEKAIRKLANVSDREH